MKTVALDVQRITDQLVAPYGKIIFDKLVLQIGSIEYNSTTGEIKFTKPGRYMINWAVTTQSSVSSKDISFAIKTSNGEEIATSSPLKIGEVVGFGIVQVDIVPLTITLVSKQNNEIQLAKVAKIKAHLTVGELLESNEGPAGVWETGGLQLLSTIPQPGTELTIMPGEIIPFNNSILEFNGVTYGQNAIRISQVGYYMISWEMIAKPAQTGDMIITLEDKDTNVYGKIGAKNQDYTTLTATALIMVSNIIPPYYMELQIVNRSGVPIKMTPATSITNTTTTSRMVAADNTSFVSSLTILKIGDLYFS